MVSQLGTVGAGALHRHHNTSGVIGAVAQPPPRAGVTRRCSREIKIVEHVARSGLDDGQAVAAGVGVNARDEPVLFLRR